VSGRPAEVPETALQKQAAQRSRLPRLIDQAKVRVALLKYACSIVA
jgi:hypothetical protein